jgi:hypothetical protein
VRDFADQSVFNAVNERGKRRTTKKANTMKTTSLLAIAVASAFTFAMSARAGDALQSPKAQDQAASLKKVAGGGCSATSACCSASAATDRPAGNARAWEQAQSLKRVAGTDTSVNLTQAPRPTLSPKDPRYEAALRANASAAVQVAPLK